MTQIGHHGDDMVLDVTQVEANFGAGCDTVLVVAALGEALDDVCFAAKEAVEGVHRFAAVADLTQQGGEVV